jgi:hypothetical protein
VKTKPKLLTGTALEGRARELGVSLVPGTDASGAGTVLEPALQSRVLGAEAWMISRTSIRLGTVATVLSIVSTLISIGTALIRWLKEAQQLG